MRLAAFVDYDNLLELHRSGGLLSTITKTLVQLPPQLPLARGTCEVRIYGGWYEELTLTALAERVAANIQAEFPAVVRVPRANNDPVQVHVAAQLALALLEDPTHVLFNTYRKKGTPGNLRVQQPAAVGCVSVTCPLSATRKLLKTGKCPSSGCEITAADMVYRHEQKIVDTMLACDLVYASRLNFDYVLLISGDDDFLPPLRTLMIRGTQVVRFHPRSNGARQPVHFAASRLLEIDL